MKKEWEVKRKEILSNERRNQPRPLQEYVQEAIKKEIPTF
jgi:hypothetical protein